jgi:hypothetical protein
LQWDGAALVGEAAAGAVAVLVPARLVALRRELFPAAVPAAWRAAATLRAQRAFSALGPVRLDGVVQTLPDGQGSVLLAALPQTTVTAILTAAQARGVSVAAIRVAELTIDVPLGGVVSIAGERSLVAHRDGAVIAVATLGPVGEAQADARLTRDRLRLGMAEDAPALPACGTALDFLNPALTASPAWHRRPALRLAALATGVGVAACLAVAVVIGDTLAERSAAQAELARLAPLTSALGVMRGDLKEVAGWFDDRPLPAAGLLVVTQALPVPGADEKVCLTRLRLRPGEEGVAEGVAGDRAHLLGFVDRLRRDPRITSAEVRSFRSQGKGEREIAFEVVFRLRDDRPAATALPSTTGGAAHASS